MRKLILKFNSVLIKEFILEDKPFTFGRKEDNDIRIDNPAVSGHHGKFYIQDGQVYLQDLGSTNGTTINGRPIKNSVIRDRDQIRVARHIMEFISDVPADNRDNAPKKENKPKLKINREAQLQMLKESMGGNEQPKPSQSSSAQPPTPSSQKVTAKFEALDNHKILDGQPRPEITPLVAKIQITAGIVGPDTQVDLSAPVTYVGTGEKAAIKIKGFLAPDIAGAITRRVDGYYLKSLKSNYIKVNGQYLTDQAFLESGALIEAGATTMVFILPEANKNQKSA